MPDFKIKYPSYNTTVNLTYPSQSGLYGVISNTTTGSSTTNRVLILNPNGGIYPDPNLVFKSSSLLVSGSLNDGLPYTSASYVMQLHGNTTQSLFTSSAGIPSASFGVGMEWYASTPTEPNSLVARDDAHWVYHSGSDDWSIRQFHTRDGVSDTIYRPVKTFSAGHVGTFHGGLTTAHPEFFDFMGQHAEYRLYASGSTTDGTLTSLSYNLPGQGTNPGLRIPFDTTWAISAIVVGRRQDVRGESASYFLRACFDNNNGTVAIVGAIDTVSIEDNAGWNAIIQVAAGKIYVRVQGETGKTVYWNAVITIVPVHGSP